MKVTLKWRGERELGDEMSSLTWKQLDLDEVLAFLKLETLDLRTLGGESEMEEKEEGNEMREGEE